MKNLSLLKISIPIFFEILLFMLLGVADTFMLSHYGTLDMSIMAVDAVGMSNQIIGNISIIFAFISAGTAVLIAQNIGANNKREIKRIATVSLGVNLMIGILFSIILLSQGKTLLSLLGLEGERLILASKYTTIVGGFIMIQALLNTVTAIIRSHGDTHITLKVTIGMNIMNVIGDAIFIYGIFGAPVLGVTGVAIATTASRIAALCVLLVILFKNYIELSDLKLLLLKPIEEVKMLLKIGVPAAMENLSYSVSQTVILSLVITHLPEAALTTRIYAFQVSSFILLFGVAIGQGTQIMIGQYVGAGEFDKAYKACLKNFRIACSISIVLGFSLYIFGGKLIGLYTTDPEIIKLGAAVLMVDAILEPGRTFNLVIINGLRGAGDVFFPVIVGIFFMWGLAVGLGYIFAVTLNMGLVGFWIGMTLDEWLRGFLMFFRWKSGIWKTKVLSKKVA